MQVPMGDMLLSYLNLIGFIKSMTIDNYRLSQCLRLRCLPLFPIPL